MRPLPRWIATLPLSVALHASLATAAVAWLRTDAALPPLILDLEAILSSGSEASGEGRPPAASPAPSPPRGRSAVAMSSAPSPPAVAPTPRREVAERTVEAREPLTAPASPPPVASPPVPSPSPVAPPSPPASTAPSSLVPASTSGGEATGRATTHGNGEATAPSGGSGGASGSGSTTGGRAGGGGTGGVVAALPPGTGGGLGTGAGVVAGAEYGPYLSQVRQLIQDTLRYPPAALRRGVTGTVHLELSIAATGRISSASVVTSSSHEMLDRAAVEAARTLPRVPFPKDLRAVPLTVRIPVVFELR